MRFSAIIALAIIFLLSLGVDAQSQVTKDYSVLLTATIDTVQPKIILHWPKRTTATAHTVHRKTKNAITWGAPLASLAGTDTVYTDYNVVADSLYEYRVTENAPPISASGYICVGMNMVATEHRGTLILVIDSTFTDSLSAEIRTLMQDISGDGWAIIRHDVSRTDSVTHIKSLILADYNAAPAEVKAVLLFGHVPVPFSGDFNPDAHPDHKGAWPADAYYADMDGTYTDASIFDTVASRLENRNIPGDGKFDQSYIPTDVELQIGRIDLWNMPAFAKSEQELLRQYLNKDHAFRNKIFTATPRGLIDDNFGAFSGEAFALGGWKNFAPMIGDTAIHELDFFTTLSQQSYLWAYGCGGGWYQGAGGVGSTSDFVNDTINAVFTILFGSYFGDWSAQDNFLRAPLASTGTALTSCWSGRPHWFFHHMAVGENIGYSAKLSMNNTGTYVGNYSTHCMHIALMGDPTLRMHVLAPAYGLGIVNDSNRINIGWNASPENIDGYYVFRSASEFGKYSRISPTLISGTSFTDFSPAAGENYYMVRAVKLQESPSGSYYNMSTGITAHVFADLSIVSENTINPAGLIAYPNPCGNQTTLQLNSEFTGSGRIEVYDLCGRLLKHLEISVTPGNSNFTLNLSELDAGLYNISITTVAGILHTRVEHLR
jgi:hypothetical protein